MVFEKVFNTAYVLGRPLALVICMAGVSACVSSQPREPQTGLFSPTNAEQAELIAFGHASAIKRMCGADGFKNSPISMRNEVVEGVVGPIVMRAKSSGVQVRSDFVTLIGLNEAEARQIGIDYERERGIIHNERSTWCAAGDYEIDKKTSVGKYLRRDASK